MMMSRYGNTVCRNNSPEAWILPLHGLSEVLEQFNLLLANGNR